jgi:hypothetical protein
MDARTATPKRREEALFTMARPCTGAAPPASAVVAIAGLVAALCAGCRPCEDAISPCPTPLSIRGFCGQNQTCAVDGIPGWCSNGTGAAANCTLGKGQVLSIPVGSFLQPIKKIPDFYLAYDELPKGGTPPDPLRAHVRLDGKVGSSSVAKRSNGLSGALFTWDPMPQNPQTLTLSYSDGSVSEVDLVLYFEDGSCEDKNQPCNGT